MGSLTWSNIIVCAQPSSGGRGCLSLWTPGVWHHILPSLDEDLLEVASRNPPLTHLKQLQGGALRTWGVRSNHFPSHPKFIACSTIPIALHVIFCQNRHYSSCCPLWWNYISYVFNDVINYVNHVITLWHRFFPQIYSTPYIAMQRKHSAT